MRLADYQTRWKATLAQYKRTKALGGTFVILPHDLWGADGTALRTLVSHRRWSAARQSGAPGSAARAP